MFEKLEENIFIDLHKDDIVINCAGIIPQKCKNNDYKQYILVNTMFPQRLYELINKYNSKMIHITTDCVYDGTKGNYYEYDVHTARDIYGVSKSLGEPLGATIIRTSIIGEEIIGKKSLVEWIKSNKNGEINGFSNHYWNGVTCLTLANFIKTIIDTNTFWKGVKHMSSPNIVTKYELCYYINIIYDLNINIKKYEDKISKNMTLCHNDTINYKIPSIYEQITEIKDFKLV